MNNHYPRSPRRIAYDLFLLGLSFLSISIIFVLLVIPISRDVRDILHVLDFVICGFFLTDFFVRLQSAENKRAFLKWGWIDFVASIPAIDALRWGRLFRVVRILRVLRLYRSTSVVVRYALLVKSHSSFLAILLLMLVWLPVSSVLVLEFESGTESGIQTGLDALWWSIVTMTTVGYGDFYPVSNGGRLVAIATMILGVGLFGTFTGTVASWFTKDDADTDNQLMQSLLEEVRTLKTEITTLRVELMEKIGKP